MTATSRRRPISAERGQSGGSPTTAATQTSRLSGPDTGAASPVRNVSVTAACGVCGGPLPAGRSRRWCSDACRQSAFRIRRAAPLPVQPTKADTVYECPSARFVTSARNAATTATVGAGVLVLAGRVPIAMSWLY